MSAGHLNLHALVAAAARRTPGAAAVHDGERAASYAELDELACRFAAGLAARGVGRGDRVVVWAAKSVETVALFQAVLRLGAVYAPVAPSSPLARVDRIAAVCDPVLIASDADGLPAMADADRTGQWPLAGFDELCHPVPSRQAVSCAPDDPAYILHTSGSTGTPKGVCLSHRNALAFVTWAAREVGLGQEDRLANHASFAFDLSVFDLYSAFLVGACVDLVPADLAYAPGELVEFLHGRGITVWYSVPSALRLMASRGGLLDRGVPARLRVCVFAGEPYPVPDLLSLRAAWPGVRLFNWFGPTETNVCLSHEVTGSDVDESGPLPVGTPAAGNRVWLEDGEIVVDGPTVMLGYWGATPVDGPYRTGDLGVRDDKGLLHFTGRRDAMVKLRGHRIELGDVESVLAGHAAVAAAAALVVGSGLDARLHAVVVPRPDARPGLLSLKAHCAAHLPRYMIIDTVQLLDELPRTANGKLDRAALATLAG